MTNPDPSIEPLIKRSRVWRAVTACAVAVMVLGVATAVALVWAFRTGRAVEWVRQEVETQVRARCGVKPHFEDLRLRPFERQLQLSGVRLEESGSFRWAAAEVLVSLRVLPLFYGRLQLERVALLEPQLEVAVRDGRIRDLPRCLAPDPTATGRRSTLPVALGVSEFTVEEGDLTVRTPTVAARLRGLGLALFPGPTGGTDVAVGLTSAEVETGSQVVRVDRFQVLGHLEGLLTRPRALSLDRLELRTDGADLRVRGSVDLLGWVVDLKVEAETDLRRLPRWPSMPRISGKVTANLQVAGPLHDPRATGNIDARRLEVARYGPFDRIRGRFRLDRRQLVAERVRVRLGRGGATASARLRLEPGLPLEARAQAERLSLGHLLHVLNVPHPWVDLQADGTSRVEGTLVPVALEGPFDFRTERFFVSDRSFWEGRRLPSAERMLEPRVDARVQGRWRFTADNLHFDGGRVSGGATRARVDARIGLKPQLGQDLQVEFDPLDFTELGPIAGATFEGVGALEADLRIRPGDLQADGRLDLTGAVAAGLPLGRLSGPVRWRDVTRLKFPRTRGRLGRTAYTGSMDIRLVPGLPADLSVQVGSGRVEDLRRLLPGPPARYGSPRGQVSGSARLSGPIAKLSGPVDLDSQRFEVLEERFDEADVFVRVDEGKLDVQRLRLRKAGVDWTGQGLYDPLENRLADVRLRFDDFPLSALDSKPIASLKGLIDVDLRLDGPLDALNGSHRIRVSGIGLDQAVLGSGTLRGPIESGRVAVAGRLGAARIDGGFRVEPTVPFDLNLELDVAPVLDLVAAARGGRWGGFVTGSLSLTGQAMRPRSLDGRFELRDLQVRTLGSEWTSAGITGFAIDRGALRTEPNDTLVLEGPQSRVATTGMAGPDQVDLRVEGALDLSILEQWTASAERADGRLGFDATITGPPSRIDVVGTAQVQDGLLQWARVDDPLVDLQGRLSFSQRAILLDTMEGRWAGGAISARGRVNLDGLGLGQVALWVKLDGPRPRMLLPAADVMGQLDGQLVVGGTGGDLSVRGDLELRRGLIEPRIDLRTLVETTPPVAYDPSAEFVQVDVRLRSMSPVRLQSDVVSAEVKGDVRWTGTNQRPGLLGSASVVPGGRVTFLGRDYTFDGGAVEFRDRYRFAPSYDLALRAEACSARISVGLSGTLEDFDLVYSSTPEMGREDIVSCLIRGIRSQTLADERNIGAFAGSTLLKLSGVDEEVKKVIPVDQIDVTTEFSSVSRSYEPRLLVAKDLNVLNRSLRLEYSSSFLQSSDIETTDQRAALKLRLTPQLELQLGWTSSLDVPLGDWGLDLRRRWEWR